VNLHCDGARVVCAQIGAREHYGVPRALQRLHYLERLVTDAWVSPALRSLLRRVPGARRFATRSHPEILSDRVVAFTASTIAQRIAQSVRTSGESALSRHREYMEVGGQFAKKIVAFLKRYERSGIRPSAFFAYTTGALEALTFLSDRGVPTIVDQIDPGKLLHDTARDEAARWPGWALESTSIPDEYLARLKAEWKVADRVIVNSEFSRNALVAQGVESAKIVVIPLSYDPGSQRRLSERPNRQSVTILWIGQVNLVKGIAYLIDAAKLLRNERIRFIVAGPIAISPQAVRSAPKNVQFVGSVTRDTVSAYYAQADLFVFPTLCDGFGITQLEAMSYGLPVIATPNCGSVVVDGMNGRIVPPRDSRALAEAIAGIALDARSRRAMSEAARKTLNQFSIERLGQQLKAVIDDVI
jgi:glycosyltransferase involved in cell wall biosynthesis